MEEDLERKEENKNEYKIPDITYRSEKDFYRGMSGELRFKAEGLFKKAKEKGISIEDVDISLLRETAAEFPGVGTVELPAYLVKVKGKDIQTGQTILDAKQMDYFNRYQKYLAEKIEKKNLVKDEMGRVVRENNRPKRKESMDLAMNDWELFEIGKSLIEDKEFGMEKTITGGCDRVIRKLMGENDWLYPGEARMLDEEFNEVQNKISSTQTDRKSPSPMVHRKATERQVSYLKARLKNLGLDPENPRVITSVIQQSGFHATTLEELSTTDVSKMIENMHLYVQNVKDNPVS